MKLYKRENGVWYVTYQKERKQYRFSLNTRSRRNAEKQIATLEFSTRKAKDKNITFPEFKRLYLTYRAKVITPGTLSIDRYALDSFEAYLIGRDMGRTFVGSITQEDLDNYILWLIQTRTSTTARIYCKHLKSAFTTAVKWSYLDKSPFTGYHNRNIKEVKKNGPILTKLQVQMMLNQAIDPVHFALLSVYVYTGARCSEALALQGSDVNVEACTITLHGFKDYADRTISMVQPLAGALKPVIKEGKLFDMTRWDASRLVKEYARLANIPMVVTPKVLRRTFGSHLAMSGVDLRRLQEIMGHSDIRTTIDHYAHYSDQYKVDLDKFLPY